MGMEKVQRWGSFPAARFPNALLRYTRMLQVYVMFWASTTYHEELNERYKWPDRRFDPTCNIPSFMRPNALLSAPTSSATVPARGSDAGSSSDPGGNPRTSSGELVLTPPTILAPQGGNPLDGAMDVDNAHSFANFDAASNAPDPH